MFCPVVLFFSQFYLTRSEENTIIKIAIEELISKDPFRVDFALLLLKENISTERYEKYENLYKDHLEKIVLKNWNSGKVNNSETHSV